MNCRRCHGALEDCPICNRDGSEAALDRRCAHCDNTGLVCPEHGGAWQYSPSEPVTGSSR